MPPHREGVEQRLGRVLVGAVAGVDHAGAHPAGVREPVRRAADAVPHDDRVGTHRLQGQRGVLEALPLGQRRALGREVDDVGGQPLGRGLEGDAGAGGVLEEEVDDGATAQGGQLLDRPVRQRAHLLGGAEHELGVVAGQVGGAEQVALHADQRPSMVTASTLVDAGERRPAPARPARWGGSCRRSRRGSAARGGRGRPAPPAGPLPGRPTSLSASRAARMVRPEKSTSSTRTTILPSIPPLRDLGVQQRPDRAAAQVVAVHRHVERADRRRRTPSTAEIRSAIRLARGTPRLGIPSRTRSRGALVALEDLVGDAGQGPGDVAVVEDHAAGSELVLRALAGSEWSCRHAGTAA